MLTLYSPNFSLIVAMTSLCGFFSVIDIGVTPWSTRRLESEVLLLPYISPPTSLPLLPRPVYA
jgi:hypothetical protein